MGVPIGTGLVEITGEKSSDKGFFCIKLAAFITKEMKESGDTSFDFWHQRFKEAESGVCAYKDRCPWLCLQRIFRDVLWILPRL